MSESNPEMFGSETHPPDRLDVHSEHEQEPTNKNENLPESRQKAEKAIEEYRLKYLDDFNSAKTESERKKIALKFELRKYFLHALVFLNIAAAEFMALQSTKNLINDTQAGIERIDNWADSKAQNYISNHENKFYKQNYEANKDLYLNDYKAMKEIMTDSESVQNIKFIHDTYGEAVLPLIWPYEYAEMYIKSLEGASEADKPAILLEISRIYKAYWKKEKTEDIDSHPDLQVAGFESLDLGDEAVDNNIEVTDSLKSEFGYFFSNNATKIEYVDKVKCDSIMCTWGEAWNSNVKDLLSDKEKKIVIYKWDVSKNGAISDLRKVFSHELAHHADWESNPLLSLNQKVKLLKEVTEEMNRKYRPMDPYVDEIIPKKYAKYDKQTIELARASEFFADRIENFYTGMRTGNPPNYAQDLAWLELITDNKVNKAHFESKRREYAEKILKKHYEERFKNIEEGDIEAIKYSTIYYGDVSLENFNEFAKTYIESQSNDPYYIVMMGYQRESFIKSLAKAKEIGLDLKDLQKKLTK
jgi:hypothetical protein